MDVRSKMPIKRRIQLLVKVRNLFNRKGWTMAFYARDKSGNQVEPHDKDACSFCLLGALKRVSGNKYLLDMDLAPAAQEVIFEDVGETRRVISEWNDELMNGQPADMNIGRKKVVGFITSALKRLRKKAKS